MIENSADISVFEIKKRAKEILVKKQVDYSIWYLFTFYQDIKKIDRSFEYEEENLLLFIHNFTRITFEFNKNKYELLYANQKIILNYNNKDVLIFKPTTLKLIKEIEFIKLYEWVDEIYQYLEPRKMSVDKKWALENNFREQEKLKNFDLGKYN